MVEPIPTCQIDTNKVIWHCLFFPWSLLISHWIIKAKIIANEERVKKLPQWVTILFGLLLNGFWSKSHDPRFILKPRCHNSLYNHTRSPAYVSTSYYINLSKMSKHWGSFLSHCIKEDNACNEHIGQAYIVLLNTGKHYQLTILDKSFWKMMMVSILYNYHYKFTDCAYMCQMQGHTSTKTPSHQLHIEDLNPNTLTKN
jgi:hypothetical protein